MTNIPPPAPPLWSLSYSDATKHALYDNYKIVLLSELYSGGCWSAKDTPVPLLWIIYSWIHQANNYVWQRLQFYSSHADHQLSFTFTQPSSFFSTFHALQIVVEHESEYVNFEPTSDEDKKPALQDANATTPAADATAAPSAQTPTDPTVDDAVPRTLTRVDIHTQLDEGKRVLMRLDAELAFLHRAETSRLDEQIVKTERDLALVATKRDDMVKAARAPAATPPARPAARAALANKSAPLSLHAGFQRFSFVDTPPRQLVPAYGMDDDECITVSEAAHAAKTYLPGQALRRLLQKLGGVPRIAPQGKPYSIS